MAVEDPITERAEDGDTILVCGASSCHLEPHPRGGGIALTFYKGAAELHHLRAEGLTADDARGQARRWLLAEAAAAASFAGRRAARIEGLQGAAAARRAGAAGASKRAHDIGARFEAGQPIIRDHHSTKRALADRAKMDGSMRKSIALSAEADELVTRARAAARNTAISSDDPDGIAKVCAKLEAELAEHALLLRVKKATAKAHKAGDLKAEAAALQDPALGLTAAQVLHFARHPVEAWALTNSNGRIKGTRARLEALLKLAARVPPPPEEINGADIFEEENRVRVRFSRAAPATRPVRDFLERNSFHWSPSNEVWQRMPGPHPGVVWELARDAARMLADSSRG